MMHMTLDDAMMAACQAVKINPPKRQPIPGRWMRTDTWERNGKGDAEVMVLPDRSGVTAVNWQTQQRKTVRLTGESTDTGPARKRDPAQERREREEREAVARVCAEIVKGCEQGKHPYLVAKGFPDELGLIHESPWRHFPAGRLGEALAKALPQGDGPLLIIPGRIGRQITTIQFITPAGDKKNILRGVMGGASHRIAAGRETWVCEGIATALSVRAALRLLGRPATVLSAFSAANVAKVASGIPGAIIAADHDKPLPQLHDKGTGEFHAAASGCRWTMPPVMGDWNDYHQSEGLRAVAVHMRGIDSG